MMSFRWPSVRRTANGWVGGLLVLVVIFEGFAGKDVRLYVEHPDDRSIVEVEFVAIPLNQSLQLVLEGYDLFGFIHRGIWY